MAGLVPIRIRITAGRSAILPLPLGEGVGGGVAPAQVDVAGYVERFDRVAPHPSPAPSPKGRGRIYLQGRPYP
jgi:hypothetical protein